MAGAYRRGNYAIIRGVKRRSETMPVKFCDRIEINPAVCHGKPVAFAGTLASFEDVPYGNMSVAL